MARTEVVRVWALLPGAGSTVVEPMEAWPATEPPSSVTRAETVTGAVTPAPKVARVQVTTSPARVQAQPAPVAAPKAGESKE